MTGAAGTGGNVDASSGEPVKTEPDVAEQPAEGTPGDEPFPPPPEEDEGRTGHPLPASAEARHGEIPETLERRKGEGDDAPDAAAADPVAVDPDGKPYPA